jgi:hypothetical protein
MKAGQAQLNDLALRLDASRAKRLPHQLIVNHNVRSHGSDRISYTSPGAALSTIEINDRQSECLNRTGRTWVLRFGARN